MSYLDNGGNLYLENVNLGFDYGTQPFFEYFGIKYKSDGSSYEVDQLKAASDSLMSDIDFDYLGGDDAHYSIDMLDSEGAQPLYICNDGEGRMFYHKTPVYKTVSSTVVLGAIKDGQALNTKTYLTAEIVNFFLGIGQAPVHVDKLENSFVLDAYPNPFSEIVNFEFVLDNSMTVEAAVYNLNGQCVAQLLSGYLAAGKHSMQWQGVDASGNKLNGGVYFLKLKFGNKSGFKKLILLD